MIEWVAFPAIAGISAFIRYQSSDKQKINIIFKNIGLGIPKDKQFQIPKLKERYLIVLNNKILGTTYKYSIPLGLPASKYAKASQNMNVFSESLKKPVELEFKEGYLYIHVYEEEIPKFVDYERLNGIQPESKWSVPLGMNYRGWLWHDFDKIPHMTVAGSTRFGKTVFLKVLFTWLIEHNPDDVEFYIIDLKGGLEFNKYKNLKQVKGVAKSPEEAAVMLEHILREVQQKEIEFLDKNYTNVTETSIQKRTFIITDEAAQLTPFSHLPKEQKRLLGFCQAALSEICRIAGALGYRNILATQYPTADCLPRQVKMNSDIKITFRLSTGYASEVAIDETGAEQLPTDIKGRALVKTHEVKEIQVPYISNEDSWERVKQYVGTIQQREETTSPTEYSIQFG